MVAELAFMKKNGKKPSKSDQNHKYRPSHLFFLAG